MALLETNGDYTFAENIAELARSVSKLSDMFEEQPEENRKLNASIKLLTEAIAECTEQSVKLKGNFSDISATENLLPDAILM